LLSPWSRLYNRLLLLGITLCVCNAAVALRSGDAKAGVQAGGWRGAAAQNFLRVYTGLFHNAAQHAEAPDTVQFASKYHTPVTIPWLCPPGGPVACFYVHEKSKIRGKMVYRLRIAALHLGGGSEGHVFSADHYQFADEKAMEALPEHECAKLASTVNSTQISLVPGGAVDFTHVPGTDTYEVKTNYGKCEGNEGDAASPITTHISGTLGYSGWSVEAVGERNADKVEVFRTKVDLPRAPESQTHVEPLV